MSRAVHYEKTADSVLFSLFIRTNGKCDSAFSHPKQQLQRCSAFRLNPIFSKDKNKLLKMAIRCNSAHCG